MQVVFIGTPPSATFTLPDGQIVAVNNSNTLTPFIPPATVGARFLIETWVVPVPRQHVEQISPSSAIRPSREPGRVVIPRVVRDNARQLQVAYTISAEGPAASGAYRVSFEPFRGSLPLMPAGDWTSVTPAQLLVPQVVEEDDVFAVELYETGNRRLVDYIRFGLHDVAEQKEGPRRLQIPRRSFLCRSRVFE